MCSSRSSARPSAARPTTRATSTSAPCRKRPFLYAAAGPASRGPRAYSRGCWRHLPKGEIRLASDYAAQLKEEARPMLEDGEEIVASIVAQPRGTTNSKVGGL